MSPVDRPAAWRADPLDQRLGVLRPWPRPSPGRRPAAYGAIVRILNVAATAGRPVRVDDSLVDHEQPRVPGVRLAAPERVELVGDPGDAAVAGGDRPGAAEVEVGLERGVHGEHAQPRPPAVPGREQVGRRIGQHPGQPGQVRAGDDRAPGGDPPTVHCAHLGRPAVPDPDRRGRRAGDDRAAVRLQLPHQRGRQRAGAADRRRPAEPQPAGRDRRRQHAGAGPARVLDRRQRQPQHERARHRVPEPPVDQVPGAAGRAARYGVAVSGRAAARSSTGRARPPTRRSTPRSAR